MHTSGLTFAGKAPLAVAEQIANAAIAPLSPLSKDGILIEYGDPTPGKDVGPDKAQFKGIFIRNLALLAIYADRATATNYIAFIRDNVRSILANDRNSVNQFGYAWAGPFDQQDAARQTSALEALNAARKVGIQNL
jgi:predicted alpha-1,6-mannanase (GH76 family)